MTAAGVNHPLMLTALNIALSVPEQVDHLCLTEKQPLRRSATCPPDGRLCDVSAAR